MKCKWTKLKTVEALFTEMLYERSCTVYIIGLYYIELYRTWQFNYSSSYRPIRSIKSSSCSFSTTRIPKAYWAFLLEKCTWIKRCKKPNDEQIEPFLLGQLNVNGMKKNIAASPEITEFLQYNQLKKTRRPGTSTQKDVKLLGLNANKINSRFTPSSLRWINGHALRTTALYSMGLLCKL